jgi:integrase/recombinase XerD
MSLLPFRNHSAKCKFADQGRAYNRCKCAIWVDGSVNGRRVLKSLKLRNWQDAQKKCQEMELGTVSPFVKSSQHPPVEECVTLYEAELIARGTTKGTRENYTTMLRGLKQFCVEAGIHDMRQWNLTLTEKFRQTWAELAESTRYMTLGRLRNFFEYAIDHDWMTRNWAKKLKLKKWKLPPTLPFSLAEMRALLKSCDEQGEQDLKALILLMRYSGLRISDAASLAVDRLEGDALYLYTVKTGVRVFSIMPDFVFEALSKVKKPCDQYFFWDGKQSKREDFQTLCTKWRRRLHQIGKLANVPKPNPHRLRDTFAVALLNDGVPLERVSKLLGHSSIKVTERHYGHWMKETQQKLEDDMRRANASDELAKELSVGVPADAKSRFGVRSKPDIDVVAINVSRRKKAG